MDFPILPKEIQEINRQLQEQFGIDTISSLPIWRVSWSNDQYEKRLTDRTDSGLQLLVPEVRELPKYQWIKSHWILERLVLIPEVNAQELPTQKQSYECMYPFENVYTGETIMPSFRACQFVVDTVYAAMGKKSLRKYVDEEAKNPIEHREQRINKLEEELFGDESGLQGKTHLTGEAIVVPQNYEKE